MGGSLGLALKQRQICRQVVGLVRRQEAIRQALEAGVVDSATTSPATALAQADVVVFATPVRTIIRQLQELSPYCQPGAVITDMGSTKQQIVSAMDALPAGLQPVGSHPMCGKEQAGMEVAEANLFVNAPWIITPLARTNPAATQLVRDMAQAVGSKVGALPAGRHDTLVATISHLPYTLAAALMLTAQNVAQNDSAVWEIAASGFRDTTRVAASDVTMMLDILLTNQQAVGHMLASARQQLDHLAQALAEGDESALRTLLEQAATRRRSLY